MGLSSILLADPQASPGDIGDRSKASLVKGAAINLRPSRNEGVIDRILSRAESDYATGIRDGLAIDQTTAAEMAGLTMAAILGAEGAQNEIGHVCCARNIRRVGEYWCSVDEKLRIARLQYLFIAPQWRRRGYGAGAIAAIHAKLGEMGCSRIELHVLASNRAALALYRSCGYEVDSYEMVCSLSPSAPQKAD